MNGYYTNESVTLWGHRMTPTCPRYRCGGSMHVGRLMAWCLRCKFTCLPDLYRAPPDCGNCTAPRPAADDTGCRDERGSHGPD